MKKILLFVIMLLAPLAVKASSTLLSGIEVDGIGTLGLSKNTYNLTLSTSLDYVTITANKIDDDVVVTGDGKVQVETGANKIIVTATKGDVTETYTINMTINELDGDTDGNPNTGSFVSIVAIVLLIALGTVAYRVYVKKTKFYKI